MFSRKGEGGGVNNIALPYLAPSQLYKRKTKVWSRDAQRSKEVLYFLGHIQPTALSSNSAWALRILFPVNFEHLDWAQ